MRVTIDQKANFGTDVISQQLSLQWVVFIDVYYPNKVNELQYASDEIHVQLQPPQTVLFVISG